MLNSVLELNVNILKENKGKVQKIIESNNIKFTNFIRMFKDSDDRLVSGTEWIDSIKEKDIKELVFEFTKVEGLFSISLLDKYEDIAFEYCDSKKKLFLIYLSKEWESPISMASAINALLRVDELEQGYERSILRLDNEEISQCIVSLFSEMEYHKLRYQINIISRYQRFFEKQTKIEVKWETYKDVKVLKEIIGDGAKEHILTKKDLIDLTKRMPNIQDSVIPLLIFEGVAFSKVDEIDELRYLKTNDLNRGELTIEGNGNRVKGRRIIRLSPEVADLVNDAIKQDYIVKKVGGDDDLVPLESTKFILRPAEKSRKKVKTEEHCDVLSYRGAYSRVNNCRGHIEQLLYDVRFTPKSIETFGKIYHINKLINEGFSEIESITETLARFGDWYPEEDGKRNPKNSQQINRLRKEWLLYV